MGNFFWSCSNKIKKQLMFHAWADESKIGF